MAAPTPFTVHIPDAVLADLRAFFRDLRPA